MDFEFICTYIHEILVLSKGFWTDHVQKLELALNKLEEKGLNCNTSNYFFGKTEMRYLGFWVTRDGVKPIDKNTSNKNTKPQTPQK